MLLPLAQCRSTEEAYIISAVTTDTEAGPGTAGAQLQTPEPIEKTFRDLGVDERIAEALAAGGIITPFPIQAATIPVALTGADVIGQAKTGTGKTLAFGIPVLQRMVREIAAAAAAAEDAAAGALAGAGAGAGGTAIADAAAADTTGAAASGRGRRTRNRGRKPAGAPVPTGTPGRPLGLVVVPTRELAVQVTADLSSAGKVMAARVQSVYGGRAYEPQIAALSAGVDVVVGTPGRLLDLAKQGHLDLSGVRMLVLDEADEMLDLGFLPDVERIVTQVPNDRQTLLFSATMPGQVIALARQYMSRPTHIRAADPHDSGTTVANITQRVYRAHALDKTEMLARMLQAEGRGLTMVFCRTKRTAAKVAEEIDDRGFAAAAVHGDLGQGAREQALRAFRNGKIDVLVATDVAARGIDVEGVTHVVNFQCPEDDKTYLHRIGRTGRAGASGTAVTFVDWDEVPRWNLINKTLGLDFHEPRETYSTSEWFFEELSIPADSKGRLLKSQQTRAGLAAEEVEDLGETGRGAGVRSRASQRGEREHERPTRARRDRDRVRTRGGQRLAEGDGSAAEAMAGASGEAAERPKRTRNRTRGGAKAETAIVEAAVAAEQTSVVAEADGATAESGGIAEKPRRTRNRTRGGAKAELAFAEAESATAVATDVNAAGTAAEEPKRTRNVRAETTIAEAAAEAAQTSAVAESEVPKRTRTRSRASVQTEAAIVDGAVEAKQTAADAKAAPAEAVAEAAEKPKRTRKKAVAETAAEAPTTEAEKPKRTRTRKTAATAEPAEAPAAKAAEQSKRSRRATADAAGLTATGVAATGNYNS